jgi:enoyl-CoA hydratase/carnithine racemase
MTGEGKSFCAGMDLKAVLDDAAKARELLHSLADLTLKIRRLPMVTLAKVNGAAIGGGCGLACVCDIAITHADSKMGYPEVDLGVCPAVVAPWLVKKVGAGRARRVLLTGGLMSGQEAHAIGIADHLVATAADLDTAATELATRLAQGGPHALRATKELLNTIDGSTDATLVKRGADLSADVLQTPQTQAALRSKMSK